MIKNKVLHIKVIFKTYLTTEKQVKNIFNLRPCLESVFKNNCRKVFPK